MSFEEWYKTFWAWGSSTDREKARRAFDKAREPLAWLIWSHEHGAWWMPLRRGYTRDFDQAGRYSFGEATEICEHANKYSDRVEETMFPELPK